MRRYLSSSRGLGSTLQPVLHALWFSSFQGRHRRVAELLLLLLSLWLLLLLLPQSVLHGLPRAFRNVSSDLRLPRQFDGCARVPLGCKRSVDDYIALTGCCSRAGLGHTISAMNRIVHLAQRLGLRHVYDPEAMRGLGHGIGDKAEAFFNLSLYTTPRTAVPSDHIAIRITASTLKHRDERELLALLQHWRSAVERQPTLRTRALFFQFEAVFSPGGALASSWACTASWWRSVFQHQRAVFMESRRNQNADDFAELSRTVSIALHVRRGDQVPRYPMYKPNAYVEAGLRRNLPDSWYVAAADAAFKAHCHRAGPDFCAPHLLRIRIFSESPLVDMDGYPSRLKQWLYERFPGAKITQHLDMTTIDALIEMTSADIFVGSRSAFSQLVARLMPVHSTVLVPPQFPSNYSDPEAAPLPCSLVQAPWQLRTVGEPPGALYWPEYVCLRGENSAVPESGRSSPQRISKANRPMWRRSRHAMPRAFFGERWAQPRNWSFVVERLMHPDREWWLPELQHELQVRPHC